MKKTFLIGAACLASTCAFAASPLWLRDVAISPDGKTIAFTYKGDIFTVAPSGGEARQLTSNAAFDSKPVWTPDGKRIVFRSDREGSDDIFIMNANGGQLKRLTTSSAAELPLAFLNDSTLLFSANEMPGLGTAQAPILQQTYTLNVNTPGTRPSMFLSMPMLFSSAGRDGKIIFTDRKGYEDQFRKHERSAGTNDIWLYDNVNGDFRQLTTFNGHDRNAVWAPAADSFYFLSEEDGTLNVYAGDLNGGRRKLTSYMKHPVRNLSVSDGGLMAYSWDGEIYTLKDGGQPQKVEVEIVADDYDADLVKRYVGSGASSFFVAPKGNELALVIRGDVYVTDTKYKTTKRITDTPDQERTVSISPDGRFMVYDSDRDGYWQLFKAYIKNDKEEQFAYATEIVEEPLYKCATSAMQPVISPDGKKVAFLEDRSTLKVIDLDTKKVVTALDGQYNYSYADGDQQFTWSPDSQWLLMNYIGIGGWNNTDIALIKADGSEVVDLTESGFSDGNPKWVLDGKAIAYESGKHGMKNTGSWGNQSDIFLMVLDGEAWDDFNMTEEEAALKEKDEKDKDKDKDEADSKDKKKGKKDSKKEKKDKADKKDEPKFVPDLDNRRYRTSRLTGNSAMIGDYFLTPKGDKLYYTASSTEGKRNLYCRDLKKGDVNVVKTGVSGMEPDAKGENLFLWSNGRISKLSLSNDKSEDVEYEALYDRSPSKEREYIFDHMLRQVNDKFYDENLHGVDWQYYGDHYRQFLPYISNNRDFAEMLSEILGELNASHTGGRYYGNGANLSSASLGAYFDESYDGEGLKVAEIIQRGPLSTKSAGIRKGEVILAIDGENIAPRQDVNPLLEGKAGKKVRLSVKGLDGQVRDVNVKPISLGTLSSLNYDRWVERNEALVDSLSGGRIGYIHVRGMNTASYQNAYDRLLGKYRNCEAVVVDTRYNGGGWLHNDLAILLGGKEYATYAPRGRYIGSEPWAQWNKPSVMLVNECNYSDASGTPYVYRTLGLGDIVGAPIPGTMTAVWWETQIDPSLVFGIPQVTNLSRDGKPMENVQLNPDVIIYNAPEEVQAGRDAQLEGSVRHLLEKVDKK